MQHNLDRNLIGKTITGKDEYVLTQYIGSGTFGDVYQGIRKSDRQSVAIKLQTPSVPSSRLFEYEQAMSKFRLEADLMRSLNHPHIIRMWDAWRDDQEGRFCMVMPTAEAGSLKEYGDHPDSCVMRGL